MEAIATASAEQASLASLLQEARAAFSSSAVTHEQELCVLRQAAADGSAQASAAVADRDRSQRELQGLSDILSTARCQVAALQRQGDGDRTTVHEIRRQQVWGCSQSGGQLCCGHNFETLDLDKSFK